MRGEGGDSALFCAFGVCEVSEYMGCVKPLQGQILADGQWKPSKAIARNFYEYGIDSPGRVAQPCGQCVSCLVDHSREWAVKMQHEASLWPSNLFVTLTFNDAGLKKMSPDGSLNKDHMVAFMKDLRREMDDPVRVYYCGEYGENLNGRYGDRKFGRPHYHLCLFNCDFSDKKLWAIKNGHKLYRSSLLEDLWPYGFSTIGEVTFLSAAYCARYCMKKIRGRDKHEHYGDFQPEFAQPSLRPGLGHDWFMKYWKTDLFPRDECIVKALGGVFQMAMPRYYDKLLKRVDPEMYAMVKQRRKDAPRVFRTPQNLVSAEINQKARMKDLVRELECL